MTPPTTTTLVTGTCDTLLNLLTSHIGRIQEIAEGEEDGQAMARVGVNLVFDFSGKVPAVAVNLSYADRVKDAATFAVEDPEQTKLALPKSKS